jgi:c(7)-type cytochrome triheme protein
MRLRVSILTAVLTGLWLYGLPGPVEAGGRLPVLSYRGGGQGKVIFDHHRHASKGLVCNDCHTAGSGTGTQLFATRKQGLITSADHKTGEKCFACHDGKGAFDDCGRCHYKSAGF